MLFAVLLYSPFLTVVVLVTVLVRVVLVERRILGRPAALCGYGAVFFLGVAHLAFTWTLTHIPIVSGMSFCVESRPVGMSHEVRLERYSPRAFPPEAKCAWEDGTITDLVPPYLPPTVYALLGVAACLALAAVYSRNRVRKAGQSEGIRRSG